MTLLSRGAVLVEQARELELRRVLGQAVDVDPHDVPLREAALDLADVLLEAADHHVFESLLAAHLDAAGEALGVEDLQQRREAVRVAVVRRGREEEPVLEAAGRGRGRRG